jgi:hypothetical protein
MPKKIKKQRNKKQRQVTSTTTACESKFSSTCSEVESLPLEEQIFLSKISVHCDVTFHSSKKKKDEVNKIVNQATTILERYHMCILHDILSHENIQSIYSEYEALLDFKGDSAIGEKDASKRSGTRIYNCKCQVGPACKFHGWKKGSEQSKNILHSQRSNNGLSVWERVTNHFGFEHVARVEVVTSHPGCRDQGWHTDGAHGLTVIFPLVGVDLRKGPTQMDFVTPFNSLHVNRGKVGGKKKSPDAPDSARAAMPSGSVVLFNANMSHRGTANLSKSGRPILVLDCSPKCEHESESIWNVEHSAP